MPESPRPRIAVCGVHIEASTFSPHHSGADDFEVTRGAEVVARYPFLTAGEELHDAAEYIGILHARALPGGAVTAETYSAFRTEIVEGLAAAGPVDGILFDIHGAMSVLGMDDAEGDLISAVRGVVGGDPLVSAPMDLHGNVSFTLFDHCDLLTCYRTAPHVDVWETRERALRDMLDALERRRVEPGHRPAKALVHVPILLPGEMTSTRMEPAQSLYAAIPAITEKTGIIDASIWIGFAWADEPRNQAAIVVTGTDAETVRREAVDLAHRMWRVRHEFTFVAPTDTFENCLEAALRSDRRPFFISDSGDNPGAGGADDCTYALAGLLQAPEVRNGDATVAMASIVDPATVERAAGVGVGCEAEFSVGGVLDSRAPGPQTFTATVGDIVETPDGGTAVRLETGGLRLVVTSWRTQYHTAAHWERMGIDMRGVDIVVVKMGYLEPDLYEAQRGWLLALTPGGVDQNLVRLGHHYIERPMLPFDAEIPAPTAATRVG